MSDDDPFGLMSDAGRTRVRPQAPRGGAAAPPRAWPEPQSPTEPPRAGPASPWPEPSRAPAAGPAKGHSPVEPARGAWADWPQAQSGPPAAPPRHDRAHPNPLVAAFAPLLEIAPELERAAAPASPGGLRVRLLDGLAEARDAAVGRGASATRAMQAAWFVAALLDDLAINTPWGGHSDWPSQSLVVQLTGEVDAGTRFFDRLADLQRHPGRDRELLELASTCLALGFRGRHRTGGPAAEAALAQARSVSARLLADADAARASLSPRWQGVDAPNWRRRIGVPAWAAALLVAVSLGAVHAWLDSRLAARGAEVAALAAALPPPAPAEIVRPPRDTPMPDAPPEPPLPDPVDIRLWPAFEAAAPAATRAALSRDEDVSRLILTVRGSDPEVFRSASAELNQDYAPLIRSVAATILSNADVIGRVTVIGHTDSVPVSIGNPFGSNEGLSEGRAATIAEALIGAGVPAALITAEGRGASEPVGDDGTREGRALNRRVEILIEKRL